VFVKVFFGGVGGTYPREDKGMPCIFVKMDNRIFSLDFGEGCQKAYLKYKLGVNVPLTILFSHLHGDHVLGIKPFLQTLSLLNRTRKVTIIGPFQTEHYVLNNLLHEISFPIEIVEIYKPEGIIDFGDAKINYIKAPHGITSYSYILRLPDKINLDPIVLQRDNIPPFMRKTLLKEGYIKLNKKTLFLEKYIKTRTKGIKIAYSGDTLPNYRFASKAKHSDLLIHEATLTHKDLLANPTIPHSSAKQAAHIARHAKTKLLALVHVSNRYENVKPLLHEARKIFPRTIIPSKDTILDISTNEYNTILVMRKLSE